jgi:hypothetical protein
MSSNVRPVRPKIVCILEVGDTQAWDLFIELLNLGFRVDCMLTSDNESCLTAHGYTYRGAQSFYMAARGLINEMLTSKNKRQRSLF